MRRLAHTSAVVGFLGAAVAAKIDFYRRFDSGDPSGYVAGHWPYWAAMLVLAGIGSALGHVGDKPREP